MPHRCAFGCKDTSIAMHSFPNPGKYLERFKAWVNLVGYNLETLTDYEIYKKKRICDVHFTDAHRNRFKRLNALAMPTLYLPGESHCIAALARQSEASLGFSHPTTSTSLRSTSTPGKDDTVLHSFPNPEKDMDRYLEWTRALGIGLSSLDPQYVYRNRKVCHAHFETKYLTWTRRLSPDAVPTLFLPDKSHCTAATNSVIIEHNYSGKKNEQEVLIKPVVQHTSENSRIVVNTVENTDICDDVDDNDESDTLVESNVCRVCLALDVKMYDLKDIELREMFQNITGIAVTENNHSILERLCWECAGRLTAAAAFRNKALLSDALLQGLASTGEQIQKKYITSIKENQDYLKSAGSLSVVEVFHTVEIGPDNEGVPSMSDSNDTEIVQSTVREDSIELEESIIKENNYVMDVKDESMIEAPIKTEIAYDHIPPSIAEENRNICLQINPLDSDNIPLREDTINSANSIPQPSSSHVEPKYPIRGYLLKPPSDCEDKIKKPVIKITNRDKISKIMLKKSKVISHLTLQGDAKLKNINVKVGGVSKKPSNLKLVKKTQVKANTLTDEECLSLEHFEF